MSSPAAIVCREIFDDNSQPSAEEITDYAHQLGIDPESESHLLPLARDGLMQPLPAPWKAYFDEKLQTHYYYNEDTKKTQWEHPLDHVYRELVKKARDASIQDDTCASVQEIPTSEDYTKHLERVETKAESDDEFSTDSENHVSDVKDNISSTLMGPRRLTPLGRPPISPLTRFDKKLSDLRISPLRRSVESPSSAKPVLVRNTSDRDILSRPSFERPKMLFKQQSEIIDLKMHVLTSPEEDNFSPLLTAVKVDKGLPLTGKGSMFFKLSKSDLPSPDTDRSHPLDSLTKSDPPKGILREKPTDPLHRKADAVLFGRPKTASFEDDRKSVRFKLESVPDPTISPGSNSSSEQNDNQSSIISAPVPSPRVTSPPRAVTSSPVTSPGPRVPLSGIVLSPLASRPPLPPRHDTVNESIENDSHKPHQSDPSNQSNSSNHSNSSNQSNQSRRRVVRPPAADYIKSNLFQKNFQKISDLVRPGDIEPAGTHLEEPVFGDKEARPRSPMIPQKSKISINLMESIESETSIDSPDREFANLDLNDLDDSNDTHNDKPSENELKDTDNKECPKEKEDSKATEKSESKSQRETIPQIKVPSLDLPRHQLSDTDNSKSLEESKLSKSNIDIPKSPLVKISPTPSLGSEMRSPRMDFSKQWSPLSTFKPLNKAIIAPQIKSSDSNIKGLTSPRLDGVILSQGKSSTDNVVVVYQFETQDDSYSKPLKSPLIPDMGRDMIERNKADERRRLELSMQKELENIRVEWSVKERKLRAELQEDLKAAEEKFLSDKRLRLSEQADRHLREMEEEVAAAERNHRQSLQNALAELDEKHRQDIESAERQHIDDLAKLKTEYKSRLMEQQRQLEIENEHALSELRDQLQQSLSRERARMSEENKATIDSLREEHSARISDLRHDYRAEVEHLRMQHLCHLEEVRGRLAQSRAAPLDRDRDRALHDKYRCLKEKYARLKHDVKMSIERRNKRREMSMTTGSETEKSNSHKANQSLERCKEVNETSTTAVVEVQPTRKKPSPTVKCNDNDTSYSEGNAHKSIDNNNDDWKLRRLDITVGTGTRPASAGPGPGPAVGRGGRRGNVAFREPLATRRAHALRDNDPDTGATTDCQDSSDATTADEKPKESLNGHGRRRCFTRLKSASTSRLNYSPKRGDGWSSPLESLRQQLRKLDDLEDQFPDLACQPAYSLRYPFNEIGAAWGEDSPELEFVRHRALVEREGVRRARAALRRRRAALQDRRPDRSADSPPSEATASEGSSGSDGAPEVEGSGMGGGGGAVLRSLRALHADVRDIWRALDARRGLPVSPETSSCNAASTSQTRLTLSAPDPIIQDNSDGGVSERARGLRAWLQTAP